MLVYSVCGCWDHRKATTLVHSVCGCWDYREAATLSSTVFVGAGITERLPCSSTVFVGLVRQVLYPLSLLHPSPSSLNCGQWLYQRRKDWMSEALPPHKRKAIVKGFQTCSYQKFKNHRCDEAVMFLAAGPLITWPPCNRDYTHLHAHCVPCVRETAPEHSLRHLVSAARLLQVLHHSVSTIHTKLSTLPDTEGLNYRKQRQNVSLASFLSMNQAGISLGCIMLGCLILKKCCLSNGHKFYF